MTDRFAIDRLLRALYTARGRGDLDGVCRIFAGNASFQITGASHASPIAIVANGISEFRPWLALMIKTFQLNELTILSLLIDGEQAAVHWRARILSKITGATVLTELVDLVQIHDGLIASYIEFFAPR